MSTLTNKRISETYKGLLKTADETTLSETPKAITDGDGNNSGVLLDTNGNLKVNNTVEFGNLKDAAEDITIEKFVDEADGIENNDNDTSLPTSAAVKNYVDQTITAEDLDFSGNNGTGGVDLDSETFEITGSNGITTTALDNTLDIDGSALQTAINTNTAGIATNVTNIATNATNISSNDTDIANNTASIATNVTDISTNASGISTNAGNIATNATNIASNDTDIATNATNIATNTANIATNVTNIATNAANIASNDTEIQANTDLINERTCGITIEKTTDEYCAKSFEFQTVNFGGTPANKFEMEQNGIFKAPLRVVTQDVHTGDLLSTGDIEHRGNIAQFDKNPSGNTGATGVLIGNNNGGANDSKSFLIGGANSFITTGSSYSIVYGKGLSLQGSEASFISGDGNETIDSDASTNLGKYNLITDAPASVSIGTNNTIDGSAVTEDTTRSQAFGYENFIEGYSSMAVGGQNNISTEKNGFAIGFNNNIAGKDNVFAFGENNTINDANANGCFMLGAELSGADEVVSLGFRNDKTIRPTPIPDQGLAKTRFEIGVGRVDRHTAMIITEGGYNAGAPPQVAQVARVIFPTVVSFKFTNDTDAAAGGIPIGGLYHDSGVLRIRTT